MNLQFSYLLVHEPQKMQDSSYIMAFTPDVRLSALAINKIAYLPTHLVELNLSRDEKIQKRIAGFGYSIVPIEYTALKAYPITSQMPLIIMISTPEANVAARAFVNNSAHPILHATLAPAQGFVALDSLTPDTLRTYAATVASYLSKTYIEVAKLITTIISQKPPCESAIQLKSRRIAHNATNPNEIFLESLGFHFESQIRPFASTQQDVYVKAILSSAHVLHRERQRVLNSLGTTLESTYDTIIWIPGYLRSLFNKKKFMKYAKSKSTELASALRVVRDQHSYFYQGDSKLLKNKWMMPIWAEQRQDVDAITAGVLSMTASNMAAALRLPPAMNSNLLPFLRNLGDCIRSNSPNRAKKINRLARAVGTKLKELLPADMLDSLRSHSYSIKLLADVPLELLPDRVAPLGIRYETSRIPATPGNLTLAAILSPNPVIIDAKEFSSIEVIRSFPSDDPLREVLKSSIQESRLAHELEVRFNDVHNESEFVDACNHCKSPLLIIDGHGTHEKGGDVGGLIVGGREIQLAPLKARVRVPPIVILSACDTHPLDRSHASTGTGMLLLGATTVLAATGPIDAYDSARFISRLLIRIKRLLQPVAESGESFQRWSFIVSGMIRMEYIFGLIMGLNGVVKSQVCQKEVQCLIKNTTLMANRRCSNWFEEALSAISEGFQIGIDEITSFIEERYQYPDVLQYVQLGCPEKILIPPCTLLQQEEGIPVDFINSEI